MTSPAVMALVTVAMMVAMMLPSVAPTLWRHHRRLRAMGVSRAGQRTTLFASGYASLWAVIGLVLFATTAELSRMTGTSPTHPSFGAWTAGATVLCIGAVQRSRWKAKRLRRCHQASVAAQTVSGNVTTAWRDGCRFGVDCALSCAAPMAVFFVTGLMDTRTMLVITASITAERAAPTGARIARLTGAIALLAGLIMCARAIEVTASEAANAGVSVARN
ncbi:MAG: DUF2182 domain-containing protein [Gemmatimonadales bacterium]